MQFNISGETGTGNSFQQQNEEARQRLENKFQTKNQYGISVPDAVFEQWNEAIKNAADPEEEAHRIGSAYQWSQILGVPLDEAYQNLESYNGQYFGDQSMSYKSGWKAVSDMIILGNNNVALGNLGNKLRDAVSAGDDERVAQLQRQIEAYEADNEARQNDIPRSWVMEAVKAGAQSLPFTGYTVGAGLLGNFIAPAVGTALSFGTSAYLSAGQEYLDMIKNGSSHEVATGFSLASGAIQGAIEVALGNVAQSLSVTSKVAGNAVKETLSDAAVRKITNAVGKAVTLGPAGKTIIQLVTRYGENVLEEGSEELFQELTSIVGQELAAKLDGYDIPDDSMSDIMSQLGEAFKGGVYGALTLGILPTAVNTAVDIADFKAVKQAAETIPSEAAFKKAVENSPVFAELDPYTKSTVIKEVYDNAQSRRDAAIQKDVEEVIEVNRAAEGFEDITVDEETGESNAAPVYREGGKLSTQNDVVSESDGITKGIYKAGDPTAENAKKNLYGYINYTLDENAKTVTIDAFQMNEMREGLREEVFSQFARDYAGYDITWDPKGDRALNIKNELISRNPSGSGNGLNWFTQTSVDEETRTKLAKAVKQNFKNISRDQLPAAIAIVEDMARSVDVSISQFIDEEFGGVDNMFGDTESIEDKANEKGRTFTGKDNMTQVSGATTWRLLGNDIKAIIYAGESSDFSTLVHETNHAYLDYIQKLADKYYNGSKQYKAAAELLEKAEKAFNVKNHDWTKSTYTMADGHIESSAEALAYGFQDFLKTGTAQNEDVRSLYQKLAEFLSRCINSLKNFITLNPDVMSVYEDMAKGDGSSLRAAEEAVRKIDEKSKADAEQAQVQDEKAAQAKKEYEAETVIQEEETEGPEPVSDADKAIQKVMQEQDDEEFALSEEEAAAIVQNDEAAKTQQKEIEKIFDDVAELSAAAADIVENAKETLQEPLANQTDAESVIVDTAGANYTIPDDMFFQIIGEFGATQLDRQEEVTTRLDNLSIAREMENSGKDAKSIRLATGWEKGADGKWKYEIPETEWVIDTAYKMADFDSQNPRYVELSEKLNNGETLSKAEEKEFSELMRKWDDTYIYRSNLNASDPASFITLSNILNAPELYKAYPFIKNIKIKLNNKYDYKTGNLGNYSNFHNTITMNVPAWDKETFKRVLLHEIQHAFQYKEGFATGGNIEQFEHDIINVDDVRDDLAKEKERLVSYEQSQKVASIAGDEDTYNSYTNAIESVKENISRLEDRISEIEENWLDGTVEIDGIIYGDAFEAYRSLGGEVESRNVETRINLTNEERLNTLLADTEDVSRDQQIILFQAMQMESEDENNPSILFQTAEPGTEFMTVYHGSPHIIKKAGGQVIRGEELGFDNSKMGTGEGNQSYGWGSYVTQVEGIAEDYARKLIMPSSTLYDQLEREKNYLKQRKQDIKNLDNGKYEKRILSNIKSFSKDLKDAQKANNEADIKFYEDLIETSYKDLTEESKDKYRKAFENDITDIQDKIKKIQNEIKESKNRQGNIYTLSIPVDNKNYIQWEKEINVKKIGKSLVSFMKETNRWYDGLDEEIEEGFSQKKDGQDLYRTIEAYLGSDKDASLFLSSIGYTGVSYPSQFLTGGRDDGARNYVIFNDNDIKITDWHAKDIEGNILFQDDISSTEEITDYVETELKNLGLDVTRKHSGMSDSEYITIYGSGDLFGKDKTDQITVRIANHDLPATYDRMYQEDYDIRSGGINRSGTAGNAMNYDDFIAIVKKAKGIETPEYDAKLSAEKRNLEERKIKNLEEAEIEKAKVLHREKVYSYIMNNDPDTYAKVKSLFDEAELVHGDKRKKLRKQANAILNNYVLDSVDHIAFQTQQELYDDARQYNTWQEFMEAYQMDFDPVTLEDVNYHSQVPSQADSDWYRTTWELAHNLIPTESMLEDEVRQQYEKEPSSEVAKDAMFMNKLANEGALEEFLERIKYVRGINFNSEEWSNPQDIEEQIEFEKMKAMQTFINQELRHANWLTKVENITPSQRRKLLNTIRPAARDYRAVYAQLMEDKELEVPAGQKIVDRIRKSPLADPDRDYEAMTPNQRAEYADMLENKEVGRRIKKGDIRVSDDVNKYIQYLDGEIKKLRKEYDELSATSKEDMRKFSDAQLRAIYRQQDKLYTKKRELANHDKKIQRMVDKGIAITEKYRRESKLIRDDYNSIYQQYQDLLASVKLTEKIENILSNREKLKDLEYNLDAKNSERRALYDIKQNNVKLIKRAMRAVPFQRVDYDSAKSIIAIQRIFNANLQGGINEWLGQDRMALRAAASAWLTSEEERDNLRGYLEKLGTESSMKAIEMLDSLKSSEGIKAWTEKERKMVQRILPKENWVYDLNLIKLEDERRKSIDLDIDVKAKTETRMNPKTKKMEPMTTYTVTFDDDIKAMVEEALGPSLYDKVLNIPFREWTINDLEQFAIRINEMYKEGRDKLAAKQQLQREEAQAIRNAIETALNDTGIVIRDDDTPEEKKKKQEKINRILGLDADTKGTSGAKKQTRLNRLLHGYSDATVRRVAAILDGNRDGLNVNELYFKEDRCYNAKQRSINSRAEGISTLMDKLKINPVELNRTVTVNGADYTIDELLYFLAADKDFQTDEVAYSKNTTADKSDLSVNDNWAPTSRNAVMFGNMMSANEMQTWKQALEEEDKDMKKRIEGNNLTAEELQDLTAHILDKMPGTTKYIKECQDRYGAVLAFANRLLDDEYPVIDSEGKVVGTVSNTVEIDGNKVNKWARLLEAISADYSNQYDRMNEISIKEFNMPVNRVKCYVPLVRLESNGDTNAAQVRQDLLTSSGGYAVGNAAVGKGFTKRRVNISPLHQKPVQTGLYKTWAKSVERTEHFIAYSSYVRELNRIYKSRDAQYLRRYMENRYGAGMVAYLDDYINEVANPNANKVRTAGDDLMRSLRGKTAPAYLSWKLSSVLKQALTSPAPYMQFITPAEYARAAWECATNNGYDVIKEKSVFMKNRTQDPLYDLLDELSENAKGKAEQAILKFSQKGMSGLEWIDWACVAPGWYALYQKKYAELKNGNQARYDNAYAEIIAEQEDVPVFSKRYMTEQQMQEAARNAMLSDAEIDEQAVQYADDLTRQCQPSSRSADIAPLFKNSSEFAKAYLQFQTSLNVIWNNIRYDLPNAVRNKQAGRAVGMIAGYTVAGIAMNALMEGFTGGDGKDDDDEALKRTVWFATTQFTDSVPLIGSYLTSTNEKLITGKGSPFGANGTDMTPMVTKFGDATVDAFKGNWNKACQKYAEGVAMNLGLSTSGAKELMKLFGVDVIGDKPSLELSNLGNVYGIFGDIFPEKKRK